MQRWHEMPSASGCIWRGMAPRAAMLKLHAQVQRGRPTFGGRNLSSVGFRSPSTMFMGGGLRAAQTHHVHAVGTMHGL